MLKKIFKRVKMEAMMAAEVTKVGLERLDQALQLIKESEGRIIEKISEDETSDIESEEEESDFESSGDEEDSDDEDFFTLSLGIDLGLESDSDSDEEKPKVIIEPTDDQGVIKSGVWKLLTNEEISLYKLMDPSFVTRIYDSRNRMTRKIIFSELNINPKSKNFIIFEAAKLESVGIKIDLDDPSSALELSPKYPEYRKSLDLIAKYLHINFIKGLIRK